MAAHDPAPTPGAHPGTAACPEPLRARLAVAQSACEVAELARAAVPVDAAGLRPDGTPRDPGATLTDAVRVLEAARRYVAAAARYERYGETGGPPAPAHPAASPGWWRTYTALAPLEAARDLDDWVRRHADGDDPGPAPVSGALTPPGTGQP